MKTATQVLEDDMMKQAARRMAEEIDREVLWGLLVDMGWHRVMITRFTDNKHAVDISYWLEEHVKHPYERRGCDFIFENERDAVNFILRWH